MAVYCVRMHNVHFTTFFGYAKVAFYLSMIAKDTEFVLSRGRSGVDEEALEEASKSSITHPKWAVRSPS